MADRAQQTHTVLALKLFAMGVMMFCFALFVMPPLYTLFCEVTGLNGKTAGAYKIEEGSNVNEWGVDTSRTVQVQFLALNNQAMPWEFKPITTTVEVHPGEPTVIEYFAYNPTGESMVGQAIPSIVPNNALKYFHKTECFCFNQQPLEAGESAQLGLSFIVDIDTPEHIEKITLSYTLFDVTDKQTI